MAQIEIKPQPGFQETFLRSKADIVIGGGAAGAGKTFAELLEPLYDIANPGFGAVIFRRTYPQITNKGGLWDESKKIYPFLGAKANESSLKWTFPSGATVQFSHLQREKDVYSWQGAQIPLIGFDELTHFTEEMFFYMLSRNRSTCGAHSRIRATCNPDPDSFVARFLDWWIDQETGYAIPERRGVLRYFTKDGNNIVWGDSFQEVYQRCPHIFADANLKDVDPKNLIKSVTFIGGTIYENKILMRDDPSYLANLLSLSEVEKIKLLGGNWKVKTDDFSLCEYDKVNDIFSNIITQSSQKFITCDHARFGRDLCVIITWRGWRAERINALTKSDTDAIVKVIDAERARCGIGVSSIAVDQDGIGVIDALKCKAFIGAGTPVKRPGKGDNYADLKTQCAYLLAELVNKNEVGVDGAEIYVDGVKTSSVKIGSKVQDIRTLIKEDLRSIKKAGVGEDGKMKIMPKTQQKNLLGGRSPDFGDNFIIRMSFDLKNNDTFRQYF